MISRRAAMQIASLFMRTVPDESACLLAAAVTAPSICCCSSGVCCDDKTIRPDLARCRDAGFAKAGRDVQHAVARFDSRKLYRPVGYVLCGTFKLAPHLLPTRCGAVPEVPLFSPHAFGIEKLLVNWKTLVASQASRDPPRQPRSATRLRARWEMSLVPAGRDLKLNRSRSKPEIQVARAATLHQDKLT
jgi:hypothetical protein